MRRFAAPAFLALCCVAFAPACGARADLDPGLFGGDEQTGSGNGSGASGAGAGSSGAGASGTASGGSSGSNTTTGPGSGAGGGTSGVGGSGSGSGPGGSSTGGAPSGSSGQGGAPSGSSGVGGGPTCPSFDQCTGCIAQQCNEVWCNCSNDPDCFGLFQCAQDCMGDEGCNQMCFAAFQDGIADVILVSDCAAQSCNAACDWGDPIDPCTKCILETCEDEMNACIAEPECLVLYECLAGCGPIDLMCQQACYDDHGSGVPTLQPVLECSTNNCQGACN